MHRGSHPLRWMFCVAPGERPWDVTMESIVTVRKDTWRWGGGGGSKVCGMNAEFVAPSRVPGCAERAGCGERTEQASGARAFNAQ